MGKNKQGRLKSVRICPDTHTFSLFTALRFIRCTRLRFNHDRLARHINKMQRPVSDTDDRPFVSSMFRQGSNWDWGGGGDFDCLFSVMSGHMQRRLTKVT